MLDFTQNPSPQKFNLPNLGKSSFNNSVLGNTAIDTTFESPTKSIYKTPIYSGKMNLDGDSWRIRNIDLDHIYNTSLSNINEQSSIIDLNKQLINKYDTNSKSGRWCRISNSYRIARVNQEYSTDFYYCK